jgi:hypothetical protein
MLLRIMRFLTLMLASLGMALGAAHTLELVPKMNYDPELYAQVTSTLYRYYGTVGGPIQVLVLLATAILSFITRRSRGFGLTVAGAFCLMISLGLWFVLVQSVNVEGQRFADRAAFGGGGILPQTPQAMGVWPRHGFYRLVLWSSPA